MLKLISAALLAVFEIIMRIFKRRDKLKTAEEILVDPSDTAKAQDEAERKADEKYGVR